MKQHRQNCIWCGKGFNAFPDEMARYCKKKCAIAYTVHKGHKWNPKSWKKRRKAGWSTEDKLKYIESL